jgi:hypothetical protein
MQTYINRQVYQALTKAGMKPGRAMMSSGPVTSKAFAAVETATTAAVTAGASNTSAMIGVANATNTQMAHAITVIGRQGQEIARLRRDNEQNSRSLQRLGR